MTRGKKPLPGFNLNASNFFFQIPHVLKCVKVYIRNLQGPLVSTIFQVFGRVLTMTANPVRFNSSVGSVRVEFRQSIVVVTCLGPLFGVELIPVGGTEAEDGK
jgi:hypothetical protein